MAKNREIGDKGDDKNNIVFIHTKGQNFGPYNDAELASHIEAGRVPFSSWLFREGVWKLLAEVPDLRSLHPDFSRQPEEPPSKGDSKKSISGAVRSVGIGSSTGPVTVSAEPVWFVIRGKMKFGPFSSADIVSQLQRKELDSTAFVWRPGFETWQRMSQVDEFSRDSMRRLAEQGTPFDILVKRKFSRAPYEVEVIAHDNTRAIEGKSMVVGEGGLFLATPKPNHQVGSRLKLHFREGNAAPFNAVAEVVSVVRGTTSGYCLRFVALSDGDRRRIAKLVSDRER